MVNLGVVEVYAWEKGRKKDKVELGEENRRILHPHSRDTDSAALSWATVACDKILQ